jgi:hypothetical protein
MFDLTESKVILVILQRTAYFSLEVLTRTKLASFSRWGLTISLAPTEKTEEVSKA